MVSLRKSSEKIGKFRKVLSPVLAPFFLRSSLLSGRLGHFSRVGPSLPERSEERRKNGTRTGLESSQNDLPTDFGNFRKCSETSENVMVSLRKFETESEGIENGFFRSDRVKI